MKNHHCSQSWDEEGRKENQNFETSWDIWLEVNDEVLDDEILKYFIHLISEEITQKK